MKLRHLPILLALMGSALFADGFTLHSTDLSGQLSKTQEAASFGCNGTNCLSTFKGGVNETLRMDGERNKEHSNCHADAVYRFC
jgi:hypothetical protein